jgi:hypothetical protein
MNATHRLQSEHALLEKLQAKLPELEKLLAEVSGHWTYEDYVYRYYHGSFKVYFVQSLTDDIVAALQALAPDLELNEKFKEIVREGTRRSFDPSHNREWGKHTRPMLEAFFHAKYFLEMAVRYGHELRQPPSTLPSGWAAFLYLYNLR